MIDKSFASSACSVYLCGFLGLLEELDFPRFASTLPATSLHSDIDYLIYILAATLLLYVYVSAFRTANRLES